MKVIIGLTGSTGSGKSSVSAVAEKYGIKWIDCDFYARKAVEPGTQGLEDVVKVFGREMLNADGTLNRKRLANKVFSCSENTELLNKTLLPNICKLVKEQIGEQSVILDAPTLFESGMESICTKTVAVLADEMVRLKRIMARDGLTCGEAKTRIAAGKNEDFYKKRADYVIYNNGDFESFSNEFLNILNEILQKGE